MSDKIADTMIAEDGEEMNLHENFVIEGEVEDYLIFWMIVEKAVNKEIDTPRHECHHNFALQARRFVGPTRRSRHWKNTDGPEGAVKNYLQLCESRLLALIQLALQEPSSRDRTKILLLTYSCENVDHLVAQYIEGPFM